MIGKFFWYIWDILTQAWKMYFFAWSTPVVSCCVNRTKLPHLRRYTFIWYLTRLKQIIKELLFPFLLLDNLKRQNFSINSRVKDRSTKFFTEAKNLWLDRWKVSYRETFETPLVFDGITDWLGIIRCRTDQ